MLRGCTAKRCILSVGELEHGERCRGLRLDKTRNELENARGALQGSVSIQGLGPLGSGEVHNEQHGCRDRTSDLVATGQCEWPCWPWR